MNQEKQIEYSALNALWESRLKEDPIQVVPVFTHLLAMQLIEFQKNEIVLLKEKIARLEKLPNANKAETIV